MSDTPAFRLRQWSAMSRRLELPDRAISAPPEVEESFLSRLRASRLATRASATMPVKPQ